jgi:hypothetical protein
MNDAVSKHSLHLIPISLPTNLPAQSINYNEPEKALQTN